MGMENFISDQLLKVYYKPFSKYVKKNNKIIHLENIDINKEIEKIKQSRERIESNFKENNFLYKDYSISHDSVKILEKEGYIVDLSKACSKTIYIDASEAHIYLDGEEYIRENDIAPKKIFYGDIKFSWENFDSSFEIMSNIVANAKANNYRKSLEDKYSKILFDDVQKELKEVEAEINKIAEKGFYYVIYNGDLYYQTVKELEKAGYKIEFDDVETRYKKVTVVVDTVEGKDKDKVIEVKVYEGKFKIHWSIKEPYYSFDIREVE